MFTADAESEAEEKILSDGHDISAQILQVGHHGSANSTSPAFLGRVQPQAAVISCGRHNEYGHPSDELIDRLKDAVVRIYRTDENGAVSFLTDGSSVRVKTFRKIQ
jgi:competence protein ComEC